MCMYMECRYCGSQKKDPESRVPVDNELPGVGVGNQTCVPPGTVK